MYFAGKLVYLIVRASNQLAVSLDYWMRLKQHDILKAIEPNGLE